jgi:hypothetical protein
MSSDRPARSASAITDTNPANDTRCSPSNSGVARDQPCDSFTVGAFSDQLNQDVNTPILLIHKAPSRSTRRTTGYQPTDRG